MRDPFVLVCVYTNPSNAVYLAVRRLPRVIYHHHHRHCNVFVYGDALPFHILKLKA